MGRKINKSQHPLDAVKVEIRANYLWLTLRNHFILGLSLEDEALTWLREASPDQQQNYSAVHATLYWPSLDDGLDIEEILEALLHEGQAARQAPTLEPEI